MKLRTRLRCLQSGFSLLELSLVLLLLAILSHSAIAPLGQWQASRQVRLTNERLQQARQALVGHALAHGGLPCPIEAQTGLVSGVYSPRPGLSSQAASSPPSGGCPTVQGFVPAMALGLQGPMNAQGALLDSWHRPIRYRVAPAATALSATASVESTLLDSLLQPLPDDQALRVCHRGQGRNCSGHALVASDVLFVLWSTGADPAGTGDQQANLDGDEKFVHGPVSTLAADPFDDQLTWVSRSELVYWLVSAL